MALSSLLTSMQYTSFEAKKKVSQGEKLIPLTDIYIMPKEGEPFFLSKSDSSLIDVL